jgi:hypothetical protein
MDHVRYLQDRACEFRNLALTMRDPVACREFHHLADLCEDGAAALGRHRGDSAHASPLKYPAALLG